MSIASAIGHLSLTLLGLKPQGWPYPYPTRIAIFYAATLQKLETFIPQVDAVNRGLYAGTELSTLMPKSPSLMENLLLLPYAQHALMQQSNR